FGVALTFFNPLPCTAGYHGTKIRNGLATSPGPPLNTGARCTSPASSGINVRGSAHAPSANSAGLAALLGVAPWARPDRPRLSPRVSARVHRKHDHETGPSRVGVGAARRHRPGAGRPRGGVRGLGGLVLVPRVGRGTPAGRPAPRPGAAGGRAGRAEIQHARLPDGRRAPG